MKQPYQRLPYPLHAHHLSRRIEKKRLKQDLKNPELGEHLRAWLEWNLRDLCSRSRRGFAKGSRL